MGCLRSCRIGGVLLKETLRKQCFRSSEDMSILRVTNYFTLVRIEVGQYEGLLPRCHALETFIDSEVKETKKKKGPRRTMDNCICKRDLQDSLASNLILVLVILRNSVLDVFFFSFLSFLAPPRRSVAAHSLLLRRSFAVRAAIWWVLEVAGRFCKGG